MKRELFKKQPFKRLFDIIFSLTALALLFPFILIIALLIKCTSKGPCFYFSQRIGLGSKPFTCWKFRTMYIDADEKLAKILSECPKLNKEWQRYYKLKNDPRITPMGKWLRKFSLDELPQFYNVLRGELSVVGPRPLTSKEIELYLKHKATKILSVRPGLTGIWQTSGRSLLSYEERILLEEQYVDNNSFSHDLLLILKTIPCMISSKGAF